MTWADGKLTAAAAKSLLGNRATLRYGDEVRQVRVAKGETYHWARAD